MTKKETEEIIQLIKQEVVPAIGCTEPVAVALCAAKAKELLGEIPTQITVYLSENVLKNAMGVGIPGTDGMIGLPIAIALGILVGKSKYNLEVLKDCVPDDVERGKQLIETNAINISLKENIAEDLYIEVKCKNDKNKSIAIITKEHTRFTYLSRNDEVLLNNSDVSKSEIEDIEGKIELSLQKIYDFSIQTAIHDIEFILESATMNRQAGEISLKGNYGHQVGRMFKSSSQEMAGLHGDLKCMLAFSCAACDARMAGAMIPVMSNSGSGNQGIAATLPVLIFSERNNKSREKLIRALILSHLTVIYIKQYLGRLSALCGCVIATTGASCGLVLLMGGDYRQVCYAVKNMIANLTGMLCDGAKPSCTLKLSSGIYSAMLSAQLAMEQIHATAAEGIIENDIDKCIQDLSLIGRQGMREANRMILNIMTNKQSVKLNIDNAI